MDKNRLIIKTLEDIEKKIKHLIESRVHIKEEYEEVVEKEEKAKSVHSEIKQTTLKDVKPDKEVTKHERGRKEAHKPGK